MFRHFMNNLCMDYFKEYFQDYNLKIQINQAFNNLEN